MPAFQPAESSVDAVIAPRFPILTIASLWKHQSQTFFTKYVYAKVFYIPVVYFMLLSGGNFRHFKLENNCFPVYRPGAILLHIQKI